MEEKEKLLGKFVGYMKSNNFSDLIFRKLMKYTFTKDEVCEFIPYLDSSYSNQIRYAMFELLASSGHNSIELFETHFSKELNTSLPGKIMDFAAKKEDTDLILAIYSKYPSLSTMALMKLKNLKKYDSMAPFLFSDNVSLANLANEILAKSEE